MCCALALKNLMSVNFGLVEDFGARRSKVEESGAMWESSEQRGKVRSNVEECRQICRGLEQPGEAWSKMEESGAVWESSEQVRSNVEECREIWKGLEMLGASVEKGYVFYFDYKLEFCPEATKLLYKTSEIPE